ncbi:hypothetical protein ACFQ23_06280 [Schaalia naturae]|uniref:HAMP domain-containing protein n=1 Tax=Schaalia naturae TaxID=635203 RepID=A0ABW2SP76_9ACTO
MTGPLTGWRRVPLTARLAVIIALAIAATVAVMGINAVSYLRENLMTGAKESALLASQAMQGDAGSARSLKDFRSADGSASPSEPKIDLQPRPGGFYVVVSSEDGRRDRISQYRLPSPDGADLGGEAVELTDAQVDQLDASPVLGSRPVRLEIEGLGEFLVTASPLTSTGLQTWGTLYTGSSLAPTDAAISDFVRRDILLYTALGAVVVCLAVVVVARSLRPLRQIASVADRIAATPLAEGEVAIPQRAPAPDPRSRSETEGANWTRLFTVELAQKYGYRMAPDPGDNFAADREAGGGDWRTTKSDEYLNVWDRCTDEADTKVNGWKQTRIEAEDHAEWEQRHPGEPYPTTEEETAAWYEEQRDSMEQDAAEAAADPTNLNVWFVDTSVPRLQEAAARWRECMAPLGIVDLPSEPWDPDTRPPQSLQDRWGWESAGDAASADEIQVATHDAQCRRDSGWFDTLYDESWNQEEAFIAEHKAELDATDLAQNVEAAQRALQTIRGYLQSAQG